MSKSIIAEGKTTNEAIENGIKKLKVSKDMVEVKVLENAEKRSFFSILAPRVVKVELTVKEESSRNKAETSKSMGPKKHEEKREIQVSKEDLEKAKSNAEKFLNEFIIKMPLGTRYNIKVLENELKIEIDGEKVGFLIGYRGETLYAMQSVLSSVANKNTEKRVRVLLDIARYKEKRVKTLEELADKLAKTVVKTRKSITLEPMKPYERKIIHSRLQDNNKITTKSVGEEPRRRVVITLNKFDK